MHKLSVADKGKYSHSALTNSYLCPLLSGYQPGQGGLEPTHLAHVTPFLLAGNSSSSLEASPNEN